MRTRTVYLDHAASSWPKPPQVAAAMTACIAEYAANPGRGSHRMAVKASRTIFEARSRLARLFAVNNANDIAFASSTTEALNLALFGFLKPGQHVVSTSVEHNSVRRPLEYLRRERGIRVTYVQAASDGTLDLAKLREAVADHAALVVCAHSSNLLGSIAPLELVADIARAGGARLLVDAAQTAGVYPLDVSVLGIDMLAFPGHKGLLGPQGTGGLYITPDIELEPLLYGGTGGRSEDVEMPTIRPDRYEAGTRNTPGIAGLSAGVQTVLDETVEKIHTKEWGLTQRLIEALLHIPGIRLLGPEPGAPRTGIVSLVLDQMEAAEAAFILDQKYGIAVRAGYHCTPLGHDTAGTMEGGAVRASVGFYTTEEEVDYFAQAVKEMVADIKRGRPH